MRVLLTGATGFLGSELAKALLARGDEVLAYCRPNSDKKRLTEVQGDIHWTVLGRDSMASPFSDGRVEVVLHAATCYGRQGESDADLAEANLVFPLRLYELARKHGTGLFLNMHTCLAWNVNAYSLSKHQLLDWLDREDGPPKTLHLELEHFYGPGEDAGKFVTWLTKQCLDQVPEIELTAGTQKRDFVYISDLLSAILLVMDRNGELGHGQRVEVGSGVSLSIRELGETIHRLTESPSVLHWGAKTIRLNEPEVSRADLGLLHKMGWRPQVPLHEGIGHIVKGLTSNL